MKEGLQYYMSAFIDICFDKNIANPKKSENNNCIEQFLSSTSTKLRSKLIAINDRSFSIYLPSNIYWSKIKYFTTLDIYQSFINIKIIPCESSGCYIRSKETFNKNGWIRKHINENKNKYLKVNPLTGEVFFLYSFFVPLKFRMSQLWNEIYQKIVIIEKELPQLLSKIINLEGKQKPMSFIQQVIQTNKLVTTIKLAEIFKQNIKIQDQFNNIDPESLKVLHRTTQYKQKSEVEKFAIYSKPLQKDTHYPKLFQTISKDFFQYRRILQNQSFTIGKCNLINLALTNEDRQKIKNKLKNTKLYDQFRYKIQQFNRQLFITVRKEERDTVKKVIKILKQFGEQVEYKFIDNYLQQNVFQDVIMTVAAKELQLRDYLWKNFMTISYETKFRIFIQTLNSVVTLWMNHKVSFDIFNITSFTIIKNLTVKLKKLQHAKYIHPCRLQSNQAITINNQKKQILKEFSNIYFEIFYHKMSVKAWPQSIKPKTEPQYKKEDLIFESLNQLTKAYYPNNLFTLIIGLNYFFIQQYFHNIEKNALDPIEMDFIRNGQQKTVKKLHHTKKLEQAKKGGPRVDLILAMCIQFLQEHESQNPEKGGEI